MVQEES